MPRRNEWEEIHAGDFGFEGRIQIVQRGRPQDIRSFNSITFVLRHPSTRITRSVPAEFVTDGRDGLVRYTFKEGDIDRPGLWEVQAILTDGDAAKITSKRQRFRVLESE